MSAANLQSGITGTDTPLIWGLEPIIEKVDMLMEVERMVLDPNHRLPALKVRSFVCLFVGTDEPPSGYGHDR